MQKKNVVSDENVTALKSDTWKQQFSVAKLNIYICWTVQVKIILKKKNNKKKVLNLKNEYNHK